LENAHLNKEARQPLHASVFTRPLPQAIKQSDLKQLRAQHAKDRRSDRPLIVA
jgi:hypothetical protein